MRRAVLIVAVGIAIVAGAVFVVDGGGTEAPYEVAVVFDTAKGMVPGQLVKIAGARVGKVDSVKLVPGPNARMVLKLQRRFGPFHDDARCHILPEGFISENYVECSPGSPKRPEIAAVDGLPTVPLRRTTTPVSLQDVVNLMTLPTNERIRIILDELGIATAGRGHDINAIVRRANPSLQQARDVLEILGDQRAQLRDAVTQTDAILERAGRDDSLRGFVNRSADLTRVTAEHRSQLGAAIRDLPPLLTQLRRGLGSLRRVSREGVPVLADLKRAAPGLTVLTRRLPAFTEAAHPTIKRLDAALRTGLKVVPQARRPVRRIPQLASRGRIADDLARLSASVRDRGVFEGLQKLNYGLSAGTSVYDRTSHMLTVVIQAFGRCLISPTASGCRHSYDSPGQGRLPINAPSSGPTVRASNSRLRALLDYILK